MTLNEQAAQLIEDVLELIPDEEHWWRGTWITVNGPEGDGNYCTVTALAQREPTDRAVTRLAWNAIEKASGSRIPEWNDNPHTSFEDFLLTLKRAAYSLRSEDGGS